MINMGLISNQVMQLRQQISELQRIQSSLFSYQHNINMHWRGVEMTPLNQAIDSHARRIVTQINELESISNDIMRVADMIRREELARMG